MTNFIEGFCGVFARIFEYGLFTTRMLEIIKIQFQINQVIRKHIHMHICVYLLDFEIYMYVLYIFLRLID